MIENKLKQLNILGQSIWLDYIRKDLMEDGELKRLILEDNLKGMTSNPSIFEKAITQSHLYDEDIKKMALEGKDSLEIYEALSQTDVQNAALEFLHLFEQSNGKDGLVSLEVNPHLAFNTKGTIAEAHRLWTTLNRKNMLIKVPATKEGLPAIKQLISDGINVNVTLLFGLDRYRQVANSYILGLEDLIARGMPVNNIYSVASFFISRIDGLIDPILEGIIKQDDDKQLLAKSLLGQVAIANAKAAYQIYKEIFTSSRFEKLANLGANPQRLLWASTSTKNKNYNELKYIEALIGPETINTVTVETLNAYRDQGNPVSILEDNLDEAKNILAKLPSIGINLNNVTQQLEAEGVKKFRNSFDSLIESIEKTT
ncbi:MAG: transaldolase [Fusobacteria bacterium]|nr:MAG: transaldolase [Fusobacteriota bacterium]KAF0228461.1 MAG: hypothetical protein FD182_717 [Fusobacteriota bacterium]